jgi:hypothetical protein
MGGWSYFHCARVSFESEGRDDVSESTEAGPPSTQVLPHELPAALREAGLANWVREPLDDAVDRRRRIIVPPAAAVIGTPASGCQGALLAEARHADTIFMMGENRQRKDSASTGLRSRTCGGR